MTVTAVMLMGARREPFLAACLASLEGAVDHLIVNDNSGLSEHPNRTVLHESALYRQGRVSVVPSAFLGFGPCRALCLDELRKTREPGRWVIFVDCDEVHVPALRRVTRELLPALPPEIGIVDGYNYSIFQHPRLFYSFDHRHNLMFRFRPQLRWTGQVHEKLEGLAGRRLVIPYRYFHYGYLADSVKIAAKWKFYGELGDAQCGVQSLRPDETLRRFLGRVTAFRGRHPEPARPVLAAYAEANAALLDQLDGLARSRPLFGLRSQLRELRLSAKLHWLHLAARRRLGGCPAARAALAVYPISES